MTASRLEPRGWRDANGHSRRQVDSSPASSGERLARRQKAVVRAPLAAALSDKPDYHVDRDLRSAGGGSTFQRNGPFLTMDRRHAAIIVPAMDTSTATYLGVALAASGLALLAFALIRKSRRSNKALLETIIGGKPQTPQDARSARKIGKPSGQAALLEGHLRTAILDPGARERMVAQAMRSTGGDRVAAIRKVLADIEAEDKRW
jgi:hypothetical protein